MSQCVGTDGAKMDPKGIQSVPWLRRFVTYHGGGPGSTWDLWWITVTITYLLTYSMEQSPS